MPIHSRSDDYAAPFRDLMTETPEEAAARIAAIGRERLLSWWDRVKHDTHAARLYCLADLRK